MRTVLFIALLIVLAGIFLPGIVCESLRGYSLPHEEAPAPSGAYVNDPNSGNHFNIDEYEKLTGKDIRIFYEAPLLAERVNSGKLLPVEERLPENPLVMVPWEAVGRYGGQLRYTEFTIGYDHYLRHFNESRLLEPKVEPGVETQFKWTEAELRPGLLESWKQSDDAKVFTFAIRRGLKWSDGVPVTTEDVRYCFENILLNKELTTILPRWAEKNGRKVRLKVLDRHRFQVVLPGSYGLFLHYIMRSPSSMFLLPRHYLKQFHKDFTPLEEMEPLMKKYNYTPEDWARFYLSITAKGMSAGSFLPELLPPDGKYPSLAPYVHIHQPSPGSYILERNPYFYKIDPHGNQLPYIDTLSRTYISNIQIENLKILSGETDLQFQFIRLEDFPMFKRGEKRGNYRAILLPAGQDFMLIYPLNVHTADPVVRPILGDVRFRRALSLALNREEIKEAVFLGMGRPAQLAPMPGSRWYRKEFETAFARYDPEEAGRLLDEMGLQWDEDHRYRLSPDGKRFMLRINYYDVSPASGPGTELAKAYWEDIGVHVMIQKVDGSLFWELRGANEIQVAAWWANGTSPAETCFIGGFLMTQPWHQWHSQQGEAGEEPIEWAKAVYANSDLLHESPDPDVRQRAGIEIFESLSSNLWSIGTVAGVPVPFIYSKDLRNIAIAEQRRLYATTVAESQEQWYFETRK